MLQDYVEYIDTAEDTTQEDRVIQLLNIMIAANRYDIDVSNIIKRFEADMVSLSQHSSSDMYTQQVVPDYFAWCGYELAHYYLHRSFYDDGFKHLMYSMVSYHTLNNETYFINCMGLFLHFREHAVPETKAAFLNLIEKVWMNNVKKNGTVDHRG